MKHNTFMKCQHSKIMKNGSYNIVCHVHMIKFVLYYR